MVYLPLTSLSLEPARCAYEVNSHRSNKIARFYLKQIDATPSARGRERKRERERERERKMQIKKARSRGDRACRTTTVFSLQLYCVIHSVTMMHQRNAIEFFFKPTYPRNCVIGDHMINTYLSTSIYHSKKKVRGNTANRYFNNRSETVDKNEINESSD